MDDIRIGEVARRVGVSPSTLRAWERKGLVRPQRAGGRHRRYTSDDIARLRDVRALLTRGYAPPALHSLMAGEALPDDPVVGKRLRTARTKRALSLRRAAERAGISASYLSLVERGLAEPSVSLLQRVASAYGGTLLEFFGAPPSGDRRPEARPCDGAPAASRVRPRRDRGSRDLSQCRARDRHLQRRSRRWQRRRLRPRRRGGDLRAQRRARHLARRDGALPHRTGRHPLLPQRSAASLDQLLERNDPAVLGQHTTDL